MPNMTPTAGFDSVPILQTIDRIKGGVAADSVSVQQATNANKQALALFNRTEALRYGFQKSGARNCWLGGTNDGSDLAVFSGLVLTINASSDPLYFSFANGFNDFGPADIFVAWEGTQNIDFTANLGEHLLFAVWSGTALTIESLEIGTATMRYKAGPSAPAFIASTQYWYNSEAHEMYKEVGGAWVKVTAILIGGCTTVTGSGTVYTRPYGLGAFDKVEPVGKIGMWHASTPIPAGWLLCNGATLKNVQYPDLFSAILPAGYGASAPYEDFDLPTVTTPTFGGVSVVGIIKAY